MEIAYLSFRHVEIGPNIKTNTIIASWEDFDFFKDQYLPSAKRATHHYCLFVGEMNINGELSISGISRNGAVFKQGASDFMVALGHPAWFNYPTAPLYKWTQAGTFIHGGRVLSAKKDSLIFRNILSFALT